MSRRRVWLVGCLVVANGEADKFLAMRVAEVGNGPQIASAAEAIRLAMPRMLDRVRETLPGRTLVSWRAEEGT